MTFPRALRALEHRDFRVFWSGQLFSLIGTWMQSVAQAWLVLELTNSPFKLGLLGALQFGPILLLSFVAGALADRWPKRRLMFVTQTALMLQALALAALAWSGHVRYWHVAALALLYGIANTLDMPVRQSFVVEMVGRADLGNAIALNSAMFNGARVVGPAVGGLLIARYGVGSAFFLNGLSFLAVIAALLAVRAEGLPRPRPELGLADEVVEGLRYAARTPPTGLVLSLLLAVSLFILNYNVLVPLLARDVLHAGAHGFGLLMAALGAGAVGGAVALAALGRERPSLTALVTPALVLGIASVSLGLTRDFRLAAAVLFVMGFAGILFMAGSNTTLQMTVPDELRGRLMSLYMLVFVGVTPFGSLLSGAITQAFGVPAGFVAGGGLGLISVLAVVAWWREKPLARQREPSEDAPREG